MSDDHPDAVLATAELAWHEQTVPPRHPDIWVRVRGGWRKAVIRAWVRRGGRWEVIVVADEQCPFPYNGRYVFDDRAIVPRDGDEPPRDLSPAHSISRSKKVMPAAVAPRPDRTAVATCW